MSVKEVTRSSTLGLGRLRRLSSSICSWMWGTWSLVDRRVIASGDQSKWRRGDGGKGGIWCGGGLSSAKRMEWSDRTELWRPI